MPKYKKCFVCQVKFVPRHSEITVCSLGCWKSEKNYHSLCGVCLKKQPRPYPFDLERCDGCKKYVCRKCIGPDEHQIKDTNYIQCFCVDCCSKKDKIIIDTLIA